LLSIASSSLSNSCRCSLMLKPYAAPRAGTRTENDGRVYAR
jgi:hypothetical protein